MNNWTFRERLEARKQERFEKNFELAGDIIGSLAFILLGAFITIKVTDIIVYVVKGF